ncbi:hypothetical protein [Sodalinema gerasimenkoae]|uniref:hypothetical protein n=1 Tax=Sodalinema gerasimenkoae TaxID=2862348 RepID=UPI00135BC07E|nr:hypothetical protein [Sodalinema gerasimenkoae]
MTVNSKPARWQQIRLINLALFTVLYLLRRPADALYPSVWNEDGVFNIPQAIEHGWSSLLIPVNGYLIIPSKIITLSSLSISGLFYPEIAYVLTMTITILVMVILTSSLIELPKKEYLPIIIALLPYDPEVFSTPLYIFWWTSLLLLVPLLASSKAKSKTSKFMIIVSTTLGCLGSPISIVLIPTMIIKAYITRARFNYVILGLWSALSAIQMYFSLSQVSEKIDSSKFYMALPQLIGTYITYNNFFSSPNFISYILSLAFLLIGSFALYNTLRLKKSDFFNTSIAFLAVLSTILASWLRTNLEIHPFLAGPRYFFFPYIFISIFLIAIYGIPSQSIARLKPSFLKGLCFLILIISCTTTWIQNPSLFYRTHHPLNWREELYNCISSPDSYDLTIHFDGNISQPWRHKYSRETCVKITQRGLFAQWYELDKTWLQEFKSNPETHP